MNPLAFTLTLLLAACLGGGTGASPAAGADEGRCPEASRQALGAALSEFTKAGARPPLNVPDRVGAYYRARNLCPVWFTSSSRQLSQAATLVRFLKHSRFHGLSPDTYRTDALNDFLKKATARRALGDPHPLEEATFDILFTDAYFAYGSHLHHGEFAHATAKMALVDTEEPPTERILTEALERGDIGQALQVLTPASPLYRRLADLLQRYERRRDAGGWGRITTSLKPGARGEAVTELARRLAAEGFLSLAPGERPIRFNAALTEAVRRFQRAHSLAEDGIVGPGTRAALNRRVEEKIAEIRANLERLRWLPPFPRQGRYVLVDVTAFQLRLVEGERPLLEMPVVVGRETWETPIIADRITYLVLNPSWNVPESITREEILPHVAADPGYLARNRFEVHPASKTSPLTGEALEEVDWENLLESTEPLPYRLVKKPGSDNPLGSIKFIFPNSEAIYLHGTPSVAAFDRSVRTLSHGCIRVREPLRLAAELLAGGGEIWSPERLQRLLAEGNTREIPLPEPVPIYVTYATVWVDESENVQFRKDVYAWNERLYALMGERAPTAPAE